MDLSNVVAPFVAYQMAMVTMPWITSQFADLYYRLDLSQEANSSHFEDHATQFDFIIVGAGTSGSVIANRLSKHYSVLLLEAGGDPIPLTKIPTLFTTIQSSDHLNYKYYTVPQKDTCLSLQRQESYWPAGKGLGGTGNINALLWTKGHDKDWDNWAKISGDDRWNSTNLLPYFKRVERATTIDGSLAEDPYHGINGDVSVVKVPTELGVHFIDAAKELGYPHVDTNAPYKEGFDHFYFNLDNGLRCGSYEAFIQPAIESHPKLTIKKFAVATKILIDEKTKEATGVEYEHMGDKKIAKATKEVIVSAGAVESPKLLMLSGIGPKDHLEELEIPVIEDLPVGNNLQDHLVAMFGPHLMDTKLSYNAQTDVNLQVLIDFISGNRSGIASSTLYSAGGYVASSLAKRNGESDWPDIQFVLVGGSMSDQFVAKMVSDRCNVKPGLLEELFAPAYRSNVHSFTLAPVLVRPKSKGTLRLAGRDPKLRPLIDPNYLANSDDVKIIVEGLQIAVKMLTQTRSFKSIGTKIMSRPFPGCETHEYLSDEYFECFIKSFTLSGAHASGTCAMGKKDDVNSVVDSELRVRNVKSLRVADASIFPVIPNANTFWPCLMIGELAAELITKSWD